MSNSYIDFDGQALAQTATPTSIQSTNRAGQTLTGTAGASDKLTDTYGGAPTLIGGGGNDLFLIVDPNTTIVETSATAVDTVDASCSYVLPTNVTNLTLEAANLTGMGNGQNDVLIAGGKGDTLVAGTGEDVMVDNGAGGDVFSFSALSYRDAIVGFQATGANHDTIKLVNCGYTTFAQIQAHLTQVGADTLLTLPGTTAILIRGVKDTALMASDFSLPSAITHPTSSYTNYNGEVEYLTAGSTVTLNTTGTGQTLTATTGVATTFDDQHGTGATFIGQGTADDRFYIQDPNDKIIVGVNTGTDAVYAWCSYAMAPNLKNLTLEDANTTGTANNLGDVIIASGKGDTVVGGTGLDVLVDGGPGGDTFAFNTAGNHDVVVGFQASGANHDMLKVSNFGYSTFAQVQSHLTQQGADTLLTLSSTDAVLIRNTTVSSLTAADFVLAPAAATTTPPTPAAVAASVHPASAYTNYSGQVMYLSAAPTVWSSTAAAGQTLTAGSAATQLSDQFGGAPTLNGGAGDDTFCILDPNTKIVVAANGSVDTVEAWCSYTMAANLKNLTLEQANVTGTANSSGDLIIASAAGDTLIGGTGQDVLVDGGAGGDTFGFNTAGNHDVIAGFQASGAHHDMIQLANFGFTSFAQVQADLSQSGANTVLQLSSTDSVLIQNTTVASLTAADFLLSGSTTPVTPVTPVVATTTTTEPASSYLNYAGVALHLSAAPTVWLSTNAAGQTLTAGGAATQLSDQFGGAPTLVGGAGDDTFDILDPNTKIVVASTTGVDTVQAWCNFTLPGNVQNLTIESAHATGMGNSMGNLLIANGANDTLIGGSGSDVLVDGGAGSDVFSFSVGGGHDTVMGFQTSGANHDFIQLTNYGFTSFSQVQSHLSQVGSDTLLTLSSTDAILIRHTTVSSLTASDFLLQLDTSQLTMTFDSEFNSLSLYNPATGQGVWKTNYQSGDQAASGAQSYSSRTLTSNNEQEIYVDPSYAGTGTTALGLNPFSISNGVLTITGSKAPTADVSALSGYQYTSGLLTTAKSFSQLYGYFEIKAELPTGQGAWPAFWLLPTDGTWPPELDALEAVGGNKIYQTTHTDTTGTPTATGFTTDLSNVSTWHTYGVLWNAQNIDYYIDGVEVASVATPSDMNKPMYMLVDLALGGTFPGDVSSNFTSAQMKIAYVHAYSLASTEAATVAAAVSTNTVYVAHSATDTPPASADTIQSAYNFSLVGTSAHTLQLTGVANINGTGNNLGDNISGNGGIDVLTGGTGNDVITAGTGNDTMTGRGGTDTFVFNIGSGKDVITDFGGHDIINISSYLIAGYTPTLTDSGANTIISFSNGASIELLGVHGSSLISTGMGYTH